MRRPQLHCLAVLFAVSLAMIAGAAAQTVWKWQDDKGKWHYSDQPGPNAVEVPVSSQTYVEDNAAPATATAPAAAPQKPAASYQTLKIVSPGAEETIQGTGGQVTVQISVEPGLQSGDFVQVSMDGKSISGERSTSLSYSTPEVDRGEHTLQARIVDANGTTLISSAPVTFYVRVPTVAKPR